MLFAIVFVRIVKVAVVIVGESGGVARSVHEGIIAIIRTTVPFHELMIVVIVVCR